MREQGLVCSLLLVLLAYSISAFRISGCVCEFSIVDEWGDAITENVYLHLISVVDTTKFHCGST